MFINCAGLGGGDLIGGDASLFPVQGSIVKIDPIPEVTGARFLDALGEGEEMAYIIPRTDCYILGGTGIKGAFSKAPPSQETVAGILKRCNELAPGLTKSARTRSTHTDLRPVRSGKMALGIRRPGWIDAYGFGGSGWTMFLGACLYGANTVSIMNQKVVEKFLSLSKLKQRQQQNQTKIKQNRQNYKFREIKFFHFFFFFFMCNSFLYPTCVL